MQLEQSSIPHNNALIQLMKLHRYINQSAKIKIDLSKTEYHIIRIVANKIMKWKLWSRQEQKLESNIFWIDTYVTQQYVKKLKFYQKVNHFPNSQELGRKDCLAVNLTKFKSIFPQEYNFFPETWLIPKQLKQFKSSFISKKQKSYYIAKPESSSQGKGIFLFNKLDAIDAHTPMVIQQYIMQPFLIDDLKFDFRIYVLVKSLNPLKIFIYKEGLARLATFKYEFPNKQNVHNLTMHLTNYAINKKNPAFIFNNSETNDNVGHKRSYSSILNLLKSMGKDTVKLQKQIDQIIVKSIISSYQKLNSAYKLSRPSNCEHKSVCFQIFGYDIILIRFDIMLTQDFKPILLQINHTPSFTTDTPLDTIIKKYLILDTLILINIDDKQKEFYLKSRKELDDEIFEDKQSKKKFLEQNEYEQRNTGGYKKIYPTNNLEDMMLYSKLLNIHKIPIKKNIDSNNQFQLKRKSMILTKVQRLLPHQEKSISKYEYFKSIGREQQNQSALERNRKSVPISKMAKYNNNKYDEKPEEEKEDNLQITLQKRNLNHEIGFLKIRVSSIELQSKIIQNQLKSSYLYSTQNQVRSTKKALQNLMQSSYLLKKQQKSKLFDFDKQKFVNIHQFSLKHKNQKLSSDIIEFNKKMGKDDIFFNNSKKFHPNKNYKLAFIPSTNYSIRLQKRMYENKFPLKLNKSIYPV